MTPLGTIQTKEDIEREEDTAIDRVVRYRIPDNLPPNRYTEWHKSHYDKDVWGMPMYYPMVRVIEQDADKCRKNLRRKFKKMLETLKRYNNPQTEK